MCLILIFNLDWIQSRMLDLLNDYKNQVKDSRRRHQVGLWVEWGGFDYAHPLLRESTAERPFQYHTLAQRKWSLRLFSLNYGFQFETEHSENESSINFSREKYIRVRENMLTMQGRTKIGMLEKREQTAQIGSMQLDTNVYLNFAMMFTK